MFYWGKVARPERVELPTFWFVVVGSKFTSRLFGVAYVQNARRSSFSTAPNAAPKLILHDGSFGTASERSVDPSPVAAGPKAPRAFVTTTTCRLASDRAVIPDRIWRTPITSWDTFLLLV
jgi:hypothetical protein